MVTAPIPENLASECKKCAKILKSFCVGMEGVDQYIPPTIINNAKGLVILSVVKAGFLFSGRVGFGLVVTKLPNGRWSAPSAIGTGSFGAGLQIGVELTEFVIILNNQRAVESFTYGGNVALGGNISVAAGPFGRNGEADVMATVAAVYSYSRTMGAFAGISLEGTVFVERRDENRKFYGREVTAKQILSGEVNPPDDAKVLYEAISASSARLQTTNSVAASSSSSSGTTGRPPMPTPTSTTSSSSSSGAPPPLPPRGVRARALFNYVPQQAGDLAFKEGDIIDVTEQGTPESWWKGSLNGKHGSFPGNFVRLL